MPIGVLFWVLMVLWLLFGLWQERASVAQGNYVPLGRDLLLFVLFSLVGWRLFGPVIQ